MIIMAILSQIGLIFLIDSQEDQEHLLQELRLNVKKEYESNQDLGLNSTFTYYQ